MAQIPPSLHWRQLISRLFYMLLCLHLTVAAARQALARSPDIEDGLLATIEIDVVDNRVHVPMMVNGIRYTLLLDTGASSSILFGDTASSASIDLDGEQIAVSFPAFMAVGEGRRLKEVTYRAGAFRFTSARTIYVENRSAISNKITLKFDGVLGREFFERHIVEIDASAKTMRLFAPGTKIGRRFRYRRPIMMDGGTPYLLHRSKLPWETRRTAKKLLLDTGYPGGVAFWNQTYFRQATSPAERARLREENKGVLYFGVIGFGKLLFRNMPVFLSPNSPSKIDNRDGIIGAALFLPFSYAIDFSAKNLWLAPRVTSAGIGYQISNDVIYTPGDEDFVVKDYAPRASLVPKHTLHGDTVVTPDQQ